MPDLKAIASDAASRGDVISRTVTARGRAALVNTLSRGDRILILGTGRFCLGWGEMAAAMGVECQIIDFGPRSDVDMDRVVAALEADTEHRIKAVLAVQVDTSTSVKKRHPRAPRNAGLPTATRRFSSSDNIACLGPATSSTWTTGAST